MGVLPHRSAASFPGSGGWWVDYDRSVALHAQPRRACLLGLQSFRVIPGIDGFPFEPGGAATSNVRSLQFTKLLR